ncbi:MAG: 50S ribosomal protein L19 [Halobacteriovoraceae bacterium]|nr:50S ribosomal protein L19 [Halobacteriovoraceae bacterium]|tara:strand:- start:3669 stop:4040 length:372 start_codon:yes stop_codon:yes gene_type:complete
MNLVDVVNKNYLSKNIEKFPDFKAGDTVSVSVRITEGNKTRIQKFEGTVIAIKGTRGTIDSHFRIRKVTSGYGVERVFPFHSPNVEGIEVKNVGKVRRAKHFYLRSRTGKAARIETDFKAKKK